MARCFGLLRAERKALISCWERTFGRVFFRLGRGMVGWDEGRGGASPWLNGTRGWPTGRGTPIHLPATSSFSRHQEPPLDPRL